MKLKPKINQLTESILSVGLSDDLEKYGKRVSDKSGTEVVKKNDTVRNLDYMNQKSQEIGKFSDKYDEQVAKQVKNSVKRQVESLKRKYFNLIESIKTEASFKYKPNKAVQKPVFEQVSLPSSKKITKPKR